MKISIISVGKKHDANLDASISDYQQRIERNINVEWYFISPSTQNGLEARNIESAAILNKINTNEELWLLDERGKNVTSPDISKKIEQAKITSKNITIIIGGAFGVNDELRNKADFVWSLSNLVFPHQLVRLILVEQLYRVIEIERGSGYHHS